MTTALKVRLIYYIAVIEVEKDTITMIEGMKTTHFYKLIRGKVALGLDLRIKERDPDMKMIGIVDLTGIERKTDLIGISKMTEIQITIIKGLSLVNFVIVVVNIMNLIKFLVRRKNHMGNMTETTMKSIVF